MTAGVDDCATQLGWDRHWAHWFADVPGAPARVARVDRGRVRIMHRDGAQSWLPAPIDGAALVTGDWVSWAVEDGQSTLVAVAHRRTALVRRAPADTSEARERSTRPGSGPRPQTLAANMDSVWIAQSADQPLRASWLDRALVMAFGSGARPAIVMTKADLADDDYESVIVALAPAVPLFTTSSSTGRGIDELADQLRGGRCAALLGRSGSGKSSLINALVPATAQRTALVRASDGKGRHTTTRRSLTLVSGGSVIDTPGVRALGLWKPAAGLALAFPVITDLATSCRFADCSHRHEPDCAVRDAVERGELERGRFQRYITLSE